MKIFQASYNGAVPTEKRIRQALERRGISHFRPLRFTPEGEAVLRMMGCQQTELKNWILTPDILRALLELEKEE